MVNHTPSELPYPPEPPTKDVSYWAWGLGAALAVALIALTIVFINKDKGDDEPQPAPTVTVTATATPEAAPVVPAPTQGSGIQDRAPVVMPQSQFLNLVRGQSPYLRDTPDDEIMAYSDAVCDALDAGAKPEEVLSAITEGSDSKAEEYAKGVIAGATVENYCPKYSKDFEKFLNAQGVTVES